MGANPRLSIVVIGRNEGDRLRRCLESVGTYGPAGLPVEHIYVDCGSRDDSVRIAGRTGFRVVSIEAARPTPGLARNSGWRVASAPLVLFLDGDTVLEPGFVERALPVFENDAVAVVFGRTRELFPNANPYHHVFDLHWWSPSPGPVETSAGSALVRRAVLDEVAGYDESLVAGEDADISVRIRRCGYQIVCVDALMVRHDVAITTSRQYLLRLARSGYADVEIGNRYEKGGLAKARRRTRSARVRFLILAPGGLVALSSVLIWGAWEVLAMVLLLATLSVIQPAWKASRRGSRWFSGPLFAAHLYVACVAFVVGQVVYYWDSRTGRRSAFDYKSLGGDTRASPMPRTAEGN